MRGIRAIVPVAAIAILLASGIVGAIYGLPAALAVFACMTAAACLVAGWMVFHVAVSSKSDKSVVIMAPQNAIVSDRMLEDAQRRAAFELWWARVTTEDISIQSADGLSLHAIVVRNKPYSNRWVVICHGYAYIGKENMMFIAQAFHEMGYWVLMPDARGHGKSDGGYIGMGWHDRLDIMQWIHEISDRYGVANIALYGISMGAATVIMAAGEPLPPTVKAVVADSGYTSAMKELAYQLKMFFNLPAFPVMHIASLVTRIFSGYWLGEASALRQIAKSKTPALLIHGSADTFVPPSMFDELCHAAGCPTQKMLIEGAGHGQTPIADRMHYWQTIQDFLESNFSEFPENN